MDDITRCAVCGWPLVDEAKDGCVPGNCSMRPMPKRYYAPERAAKEYGPALPPSEEPPPCPSCASLRSQLEEAKLDLDIIKTHHYAKSPCGHSSQYAYTDDGGKHIICLKCDSDKLAAANAAREKAESASDVAMISAHRACCGTEHDPQSGKLHGYCVVCGVPWPCQYADPRGLRARAEQAEAARDEAEGKIKVLEEAIEWAIRDSEDGDRATAFSIELRRRASGCKPTP